MKTLKKILCGILSAAIMITSAACSVAADDDIRVVLDGNVLSFEVPPQIINDRTMVPLRAIFEALGASVDWDQETRTVTSAKDGTTVRLTVDSDTMYVNDNAVILDSPACIIDGRTLVPVRAISEAYNTVAVYTGGVSQMKQIFNEDWDTDILGEFDTTVTFGDNEYHITSTALNYKSFYSGMEYNLTINDASVIYNSGDYYNIEYAYAADIDPDDDSIILFVLPTYENGYESVTAYKYSPSEGIVQLSFDFDGDGVSESVLEPGRRCSDFTLGTDGTFGLVTGTKSLGMWGLQRNFRLNENGVFVFEHQDNYKIKYWADGENTLQTYDRGSDQPRTLTYEEAKNNMMYCIESEQDYEMLLKGYYGCKQSYGDLRAGDYFKLVYDDNDGNVMFVTSDGREGWINVNTIGSDQKLRGRIGGFALMLAG